MKFYIHSGELRGIISGDKPLSACISLLKLKGNGKMLDSTWFCVDERGFRPPNDCNWTISVDKVLKKAGYVVEGDE